MTPVLSDFALEKQLKEVPAIHPIYLKITLQETL
jgi:hypothetical protein